MSKAEKAAREFLKQLQETGSATDTTQVIEDLLGELARAEFDRDYWRLVAKKGRKFKPSESPGPSNGLRPSDTKTTTEPQPGKGRDGGAGDFCSYTFEAYEESRRRAMRPGAGEDTLLLAALGLCGEAGEVAELVKKDRFHGKPAPRERLLEELGDVLWYVMCGAVALGTSLEVVARANDAKLAARYPHGFRRADEAPASVPDGGMDGRTP